MRRIFGGTSLAGSSTSNSLASDALPSPTSASHDHSAPETPSYESGSTSDAPPEAKKGWFGGLGTGLARTASAGSTKTSASGTAQPTASSSKLVESFHLDLEDDFDPEMLPFAQARSPPPPMSPPQTAGHRRDSSRSSLGAAFGASARPLSPETSSAETAAVPKDALMIELLSGAAVLEARDYEILEWDTMQEIKKEHTLLATRISSLTRSVALETRLRDSAAKLVRLSAPATATPDPSNPASPARPRVTREQAEAQLATAQAKLDGLEADLRKISSRESKLRTKLLRHTAGVLATSLRRKEEEQVLGGPTPFSPALASSSAAISAQRRNTPSPTGSGSGANNRFSGAHFFAGNREAIVPQTRPGRGSPYASPQPDQSSFGVNSVQLQHDLEEQTARVKELERQLEEATSRADRDAHDTRQELERARLQAHEEQDRMRRHISEAQADAEGLREELHAAHDDLEQARREAQEARDEVQAHRGLQGPSEDAQREIAAAKQDAQDSARKLRDLGMELAEAEHKLGEAEERVKELEEELQRSGEERADERNALQVKLDAATSASVDAPGRDEVDTEATAEARQRVRQLEEERQSVMQAIGDVLRRHRTRPTLGVVLRDLPSFDDTTERSDLPTYLASTLDAHFDKSASHVSDLSSDLSSLRDEHDSARSGLDDELAQAHERAQALESDVESLHAERESLETELELLRSQAQEHETKLANLPKLESDLALAASASTRAQSDLSAAQGRVADLEAQVAKHEQATAKLQDLWRAIPPLENRSRANSQSDDLTVLKNAFEGSSPPLPPRKPIGAFLKTAIGAGGGSADTASSDFSVDALVDRVKRLLAEDQKLVKKLVTFENEKGEFEEMRKKAVSGEAGLEQKVKELEERIEVSANQEVAMLERLNDLTASLEQTRAEKRKLEAQIRTLEDDKSQLQQQLSAAQAAPPATDNTTIITDDSELQELRDQIADLEEELADAQKREQKTRAQLLDELSQAQGELSTLKTQLRQAQRKLGSKA
ncbi:uncharacterized protein JCM10292_000432 [Rhodotorula paludigena]|uniref:uncharacterized protein n=1 Tax=Rhodotorula paludigena TaxID=86838 RepID=UPI0031770C14